MKLVLEMEWVLNEIPEAFLREDCSTEFIITTAGNRYILLRASVGRLLINLVNKQVSYIPNEIEGVVL